MNTNCPWCGAHYGTRGEAGHFFRPSWNYAGSAWTSYSTDPWAELGKKNSELDALRAELAAMTAERDKWRTLAEGQEVAYGELYAKLLDATTRAEQAEREAANLRQGVSDVAERVMQLPPPPVREWVNSMLMALLRGDA